MSDKAPRSRAAKSRGTMQAASIPESDGVLESGEVVHGRLDRLALYRLDDVRTATGMVPSATGQPWWGDEEAPRETEHQCRLAEIIGRGEPGRWRGLAGPAPHAVDDVEALVARAPHLQCLGRLATTHLRAAATIGLPIKIPPVLLVGPPGVGKSWFLSRFSAALGVPFRRLSMSASTLAEGLQGAHPSWRNAQPGLVAKVLFGESVANPVVFVDEFDKVAAHSFNVDPYRAYYALLDPSDASAFTDEYYGFPMDASRIIWVMAANDAECLPAPIADRLKILHVPEPDVGQRARIAQSIYAEANDLRRRFFDIEMGPIVLERLVGMTPRAMRRRLDDAMASAAADGRRSLVADDLAETSSVRPRTPIGFFG